MNTVHRLRRLNAAAHDTLTAWMRLAESRLLDGRTKAYLDGYDAGRRDTLHQLGLSEEADRPPEERHRW